MKDAAPPLRGGVFRPLRFRLLHNTDAPVSFWSRRPVNPVDAPDLTMSFSSATFLLSASLLLSSHACSNPSAPRRDPREELSAGVATLTGSFPTQALSPPRGLPREDRLAFFAGKALAEQPWVKAPSVTDARDGLGPLYNAQTCLDCHNGGGRGRAPETGTSLEDGVVRLSVEDPAGKKSPLPEPTYGHQIQSRSVSLGDQLHLPGAELLVPKEAEVLVHWEESKFFFPDGTYAKLRRPRLELTELGYGALHPHTRMSLRIAPPLHGMGLIASIPSSEIVSRQDADDLDGDGISGRANWVLDPKTKRRVLGRFGLKANRSSLEEAVASAFVFDMGISNPLFSFQPCSAVQEGCLAGPDGNNESGLELDDSLFELVAHFSAHVGVPARRTPASPEVLEGRELFFLAGCADCHHPGYTTSETYQRPFLGGQRIWPYSDFLLHDMGNGLSDQRKDQDATGSEWRTSPLWGLGQSATLAGQANYLHDGRARTIEEAILWHGGEAEPARDAYIELPRNHREILLSFLQSL